MVTTSRSFTSGLVNSKVSVYENPATKPSEEPLFGGQQADKKHDGCYHGGYYPGYGRIILYDPGIHCYTDGIDDSASNHGPDQ